MFSGCRGKEAIREPQAEQKLHLTKTFILPEVERIHERDAERVGRSSWPSSM
jgi:hypothetical protein